MSVLLKIAGILTVWIAPLAGGCTSGARSRIELISLDSDGGRSIHPEEFDEGYYRVRSDGRADVLLEKTTPHSADASTTITQLLLLRCFWKPDPGRTHADDSMINARVSYLMLKNQSGVCYEGGAFVDYDHNARRGLISGTVEGGTLHPLRRVGQPRLPFEQGLLSGRFKARHNDRRVVRAINEAERMLGPLPSLKDSQTHPDY